MDSKFKSMIETIIFSLFLLPFIVRNPLLIDEINRQIQNNDNKVKRQALDDLIALINCDEKPSDLTIEILLPNDKNNRTLVITREDNDKCIREIAMKISSMDLTYSVEEQLQQNPLAAKILAVLKERFPNLTEETLRAKAYKISLCKDEEEWKRVIKELNQENKNNAQGAVFKKYSFFPSRQTELRSDEYFHQYIAAFHFYRMLSKWSLPNAVIPVPLRKVANPEDAVSSFDFIKNPGLEELYVQQKEIFRKEGRETREVYLFHGTAVANIDSILKENLSPDFTSEHQGNEKKKVFGEGIYFSQFPAVSLMYGNGLILFKVLLGNCELFTPKALSKQPEIPEIFDSREVRASDGSSVIHVVKKPSQVLPYCVVQFNNEALSSEYHKPNLGQGDPQILTLNADQADDKRGENDRNCPI